jgi:hypothetical protein
VWWCRLSGAVVAVSLDCVAVSVQLAVAQQASAVYTRLQDMAVPLCGIAVREVYTTRQQAAASWARLQNAAVPVCGAATSVLLRCMGLLRRQTTAISRKQHYQMVPDQRCHYNHCLLWRQVTTTYRTMLSVVMFKGVTTMVLLALRAGSSHMQ